MNDTTGRRKNMFSLQATVVWSRFSCIFWSQVLFYLSCLFMFYRHCFSKQVKCFQFHLTSFGTHMMTYYAYICIHGRINTSFLHLSYLSTWWIQISEIEMSFKVFWASQEGYTISFIQDNCHHLASGIITALYYSSWMHAGCLKTHLKK